MSSVDPQFSRILETLKSGGVFVDDMDDPDVVLPGVERAIAAGIVERRGNGWTTGWLYELTPLGRKIAGVETKPRDGWSRTVIPALRLAMAKWLSSGRK